MRYISLFSGIEAASVAFDRLGWEADWSEYEGSVDVVIGGSPCQSFSVAGKREGLRGESRLMWEYVRAVRSIRPTVFIWENVKGALTSEDGEAFGQLLSEMDGCGYGLAWRVLDAQFFNLAQRRERVFLVGVLGERGGARTACEILFEPDCLRWDNPTSKRKREELAADAPSRPQRGDRRAGRGLRTGGATAFLHHLSAKTRSMGEAFEQSPTLTAARVPAVTHKAD